MRVKRAETLPEIDVGRGRPGVADARLRSPERYTAGETIPIRTGGARVHVFLPIDRQGRDVGLQNARPNARPRS